MMYNTLYDLFEVLEDVNGWTLLDIPSIKEDFKQACEDFDKFDKDVQQKVENVSYDEVDEIEELLNYDPYEIWWAAHSRRHFIFRALNEIEQAIEKAEEVIVDLSIEYQDIKDTNIVTIEKNNEKEFDMAKAKFKKDVAEENKITTQSKNNNSSKNIGVDVSEDFHDANDFILQHMMEDDGFYATHKKEKEVKPVNPHMSTTKNTTNSALVSAVRNTVDKDVIRQGALSRSKIFICDKNFKIDDAINYLDDITKTAVIIAKNGVFELVRSRFGIFHIKSNNLNLPMRKLKDFSFEDKWFIPKPDYELLLKLWKMDRYVMKTNNGAEFYASLFWNANENKYEIVVPEQTVSGASVHFEEPIDTDEKFLVIDHHSHNTMSAFFSGTDDNNDYSRFKISLVMGRISDAGFDTKQRIVINGLFRDIELTEIFDNVPGDDLEPELVNLIKAKVKKPQAYHYPHHNTHNSRTLFPYMK